MKKRKDDKYSLLDQDVMMTREDAHSRYKEGQEKASDDQKDSFEDLVESKIKDAMRAGEFDNLNGKGQPLDLERYSKIPQHLRTAYHVFKNSGYIPEEIRLKKEMERIKEEIKKCNSTEEKRVLVKELAEVSQQFYFYMDYNKQFKP